MYKLIPWDWKDISQATNHNGCAVYAIRLLNNQHVQPIHRFLATDTEGLLTIGMTKNLESRRHQFIQGTIKGYGHSAANLVYILKKNSPSFNNLLPEPRFQIAYRITENDIEARQLESKFTGQYFQYFGECPPFTSVLPNRYGSLDNEPHE